MRSVGLVLVVIGGLVVYLGWNGKLSDAMKALFSGQVPTKVNPGPAASDPHTSGYSDPSTGYVWDYSNVQQ